MAYGDLMVKSGKRLLEGKEVPALDGASLLPGLPQELAVQCLARLPVSSLWRVSKSWRRLVRESREFHRVRDEVGGHDVLWLYTLVHTEGGSCGWHAFDPLSQRWHSLPPMPEAVKFELTEPGFIGFSHSIQTASTRKKLVMISGVKRRIEALRTENCTALDPALEHPFIFDTQKCEWVKGSRFGTSRKWCACGVVNNEVFVASGCGVQWNMNLSKSVEAYNPDTDKWTSLQPLRSSKFSGEAISAVTCEGKLYMMSGLGVFAREGAVYSPVSGTWSKMLPGLKKGWTDAVVVVDGKFYSLDSCGGKLKIYDEAEDCWNLIFEDFRLKNLSQVCGRSGKIFGVVTQLGSSGSAEVSQIRILDVSSPSPTMTELSVPWGRVVSIQVLARMDPK